MPGQLVQYQIADGVCRAKLNRPDKLNALTTGMLTELIDLVRLIESDPSIGVFVLSGVGRAFSAGVDLKVNEADSFASDGGVIPQGIELNKMMSSMRAVTIAEVHGYCFTGALELALMFDMIFCDEATKFGDTHAKWAIVPRWGMTQRLARRCGIARAKEMSFRAHHVLGPEAERIGLANRCYPTGELTAGVDQVVSDIMGNSKEAIAVIKRLYNDGWATTLAEGLQIELDEDPNLSDTSSMLDQFEQKKGDK